LLPPRFEEPAGFTWGTFKASAPEAKGATIWYGSLQPKGTPKGTIVMVSGFRELTQKYFEVMRDLTDRGFAVWMMDWHGQGRSDRYLPNPQKMYSVGYEEHIATLDQFTNEIVKKSDGPLLLMGHSMGAHIGLRYLKEHDGVFDSAIFSSPMCDILTPGFPRPVAVKLADLAYVGHFLDRYTPGVHDWDGTKDTFEGNNVTHDRARFGVIPEIFKRNPLMIMGSHTYGWVRETFKSIRILNNPDYLKSIKTPMLIGIAGEDKIVNEETTRKDAALIPNCRTVELPGARHELWMEEDKLRNAWLAAVDKFLDERVSLHATASPKPDNTTKRAPGP